MKKYLKNNLLRIMNLILIFMSITKKKYKLMEMDANIDYSELMFIFLKIFYLQKFMKKKHAGRNLIFEEKRKKVLEKNLVVNLLELVQVKKVTQVIKSVEYKHSLVS